MAEPVDATDLKSVGPYRPCQFDSGYPHQGADYVFFPKSRKYQSQKQLPKLFKNLCGLAFGDKGYIGKKWAERLHAVEFISSQYSKGNVQKKVPKTTGETMDS